MTIKKTFGWVLLVTLLLSLFTAQAIEHGVIEVLIAWIVGSAIIGLIITAVSLIATD